MSANAHKPIIAILILLVASFSSAHARSEEHTSELQSRLHLVCRLLLEKKKRLETRHVNELETAFLVVGVTVLEVRMGWLLVGAAAAVPFLLAAVVMIGLASWIRVRIAV